MSEDDRNFSKDAYDLNENYTYNIQPYQNTDKIDDDKIMMDREEKELENYKKREKEDFKRDKKFYYGLDPKKEDQDMLQRDVDRDYTHEKRQRKTSAEIAKNYSSSM